MDQIYRSIRAGLQAAKAKNLPKAGRVPLELLEPFLSFEQRNRGHQHLLADALLNPSPQKALSAQEQETWTRKQTVCDTTNQLLASLLRLSTTYQDWPTLLQPAIDTPDLSGWLELHALSQLRYSAVQLFRDSAPAKSPYKLGSVSCSEKDSFCIFEGNFNLEGIGFYASKEWKLSKPKLFSLASSIKFIRDAQAVLQNDFKEVTSWPELSQKKVDEWLIATAKEAFAQQLRMYPKNHQKVIRDNWDKVKPF